MGCGVKKVLSITQGEGKAGEQKMALAFKREPKGNMKWVKKQPRRAERNQGRPERKVGIHLPPVLCGPSGQGPMANYGSQLPQQRSKWKYILAAVTLIELPTFTRDYDRVSWGRATPNSYSAPRVAQ